MTDNLKLRNKLKAGNDYAGAEQTVRNPFSKIFPSINGREVFVDHNTYAVVSAQPSGLGIKFVLPKRA